MDPLYKGIYGGKQNMADPVFYEGGAHFRYSDLVYVLDGIIQERKKLEKMIERNMRENMENNDNFKKRSMEKKENNKDKIAKNNINNKDINKDYNNKKDNYSKDNKERSHKKNKESNLHDVDIDIKIEVKDPKRVKELSKSRNINLVIESLSQNLELVKGKKAKHHVTRNRNKVGNDISGVKSQLLYIKNNFTNTNHRDNNKENTRELNTVEFLSKINETKKNEKTFSNSKTTIKNKTIKIISNSHFGKLTHRKKSIGNSNDNLNNDNNDYNTLNKKALESINIPSKRKNSTSKPRNSKCEKTNVKSIFTKINKNNKNIKNTNTRKNINCSNYNTTNNNYKKINNNKTISTLNNNNSNNNNNTNYINTSNDNLNNNKTLTKSLPFKFHTFLRSINMANGSNRKKIRKNSKINQNINSSVLKNRKSPNKTHNIDIDKNISKSPILSSKNFKLKIKSKISCNSNRKISDSNLDNSNNNRNSINIGYNTNNLYSGNATNPVHIVSNTNDLNNVYSNSKPSLMSRKLILNAKKTLIKRDFFYGENVRIPIPEGLRAEAKSGNRSGIGIGINTESNEINPESGIGINTESILGRGTKILIPDSIIGKQSKKKNGAGRLIRTGVETKLFDTDFLSQSYTSRSKKPKCGGTRNKNNLPEAPKTQRNDSSSTKNVTQIQNIIVKPNINVSFINNINGPLSQNNYTIELSGSGRKRSENSFVGNPNSGGINGLINYFSMKKNTPKGVIKVNNYMHHTTKFGNQTKKSTIAAKKK